ncbi:hypothetical protein [uncultured Clostridium sp.]|nr:hypothetical protein [uncultured Clostridium sp.]
MFRKILNVDRELAKKFTPPTWFGKDVTNDKSYKMKNYWKRTRLDT